jgi:hypothetical protein
MPQNINDRCLSTGAGPRGLFHVAVTMRTGHDKVPSSVSSQRVLKRKTTAPIMRVSTLTCQVKPYKSPTLSSCPTIGSEQSKSDHSNVPCMLARSSLPSFSANGAEFPVNKGTFERGVLASQTGEGGWSRICLGLGRR